MYLNQSHNSPYWAQPRPQLAFLILIMLWMPRSPFADLGWWALLPMLAIVGDVLWWTLSPDGRSGVLRTMQRLQKDVHWFQLRPVTCHELGDGDELRSRIPGMFEGWEAKTVLTLENGQAWQIADGSRAYYQLRSPLVRIVRGAVSGYYLEVEGVAQRPRVRRVK